MFSPQYPFVNSKKSYKRFTTQVFFIQLRVQLRWIGTRCEILELRKATKISFMITFHNRKLI